MTAKIDNTARYVTFTAVLENPNQPANKLAEISGINIKSISTVLTDLVVGGLVVRTKQLAEGFFDPGKKRSVFHYTAATDTFTWTEAQQRRVREHMKASVRGADPVPMAAAPMPSAPTFKPNPAEALVRTYAPVAPAPNRVSVTDQLRGQLPDRARVLAEIRDMSMNDVAYIRKQINEWFA